LDRLLKFYGVAVPDATCSCSTWPSGNFAPIAAPVNGSVQPAPSDGSRLPFEELLRYKECQDSGASYRQDILGPQTFLQRPVQCLKSCRFSLSYLSPVDSGALAAAWCRAPPRSAGCRETNSSSTADRTATPSP